MFQTYIIYSESLDQYYTGHTSVGVEKRLARHNDGRLLKYVKLLIDSFGNLVSP